MSYTITELPNNDLFLLSIAHPSGYINLSMLESFAMGEVSSVAA